MQGGLELVEFVIFLLGLPIVISLIAVWIFRFRFTRWSELKRAFVLASPGPLLETAIALFLIISAYMSDCPADEVCDGAGLIFAGGAMMIVSAIFAYVVSVFLADSILRRASAKG
jgi:hypothetical protein